MQKLIVAFQKQIDAQKRELEAEKNEVKKLAEQLQNSSMDTSTIVRSIEELALKATCIAKIEGKIDILDEYIETLILEQTLR